MRVWILAILLGFSGCISIATYEKQMKKCRDKSDELEQTKTKLSNSEARNLELEKALEEKEGEHEILKSEMSSMRSTYDELVEELKDNIVSGEVGVQQNDKGLTITMGNQILFASGKSDLQPKGKKVLAQIAGVIKKSKGHLIQVEGHTDNQRIAGPLKARFPSNWDLSAARAASVVRHLQDDGKIDPSLLVLTAFAEYHPLKGNDTREGRQENRRVEITLVPKKS